MDCHRRQVCSALEQGQGSALAGSQEKSFVLNNLWISCFSHQLAAFASWSHWVAKKTLCCLIVLSVFLSQVHRVTLCGPFYATMPRKMPLLLVCRSKKASKRISVPLLQIHDKSRGTLISEACKLCWQCETWGRGAEKDDFKKPQKPQQSGEGLLLWHGSSFLRDFVQRCSELFHELSFEHPDMNQTQHTIHHLLIHWCAWRRNSPGAWISRAKCWKMRRTMAAVPALIFLNNVNL